MEINISEVNKKKIEKLDRDKKLDEYDSFYKKDNYKISLINVDSAFRDINPKNIYSANVEYLPNNPLTFTEDSGSIQVNYPNHNFVLGDSLIVQNVEPFSYVLSGGLYLFQNSSYFYIKLNNYINSKYLSLTNKLKIDISVLQNANMENIYFYGNIPLNSIVGTFPILLPSVVDSTNSISQTILNYFNVSSAADMDGKYLLINLPYNYYSNTLQILEITDFFKLTFTDLYGIPINGINADFPINYLRLQSSQIVSSVIDSNTFIIDTNYKCISSGTGGGNKVQIMKIINTIEGFPDNNNYKIKLKKSYNNVVRIELVSSEFTYVDYLIKNSGVNKNNNIYWKHLDDGNHIYTASIKEGNYDSATLIDVLISAMNSVPRITSTVENPIYNNFSINLNSYTQEIVFTAFKTDKLPNSLKIDIFNINNIDYFRLTIKHPNNLVEVNDLITITNSLDLGVISKSYVNKTLTVYEVNKENNSYTVLLGSRNQITNSTDLKTTLTNDGGGAVEVKTKARFSFLFNYSDTIGNILGFKNVGSSNAITPFSTSISNFNLYLNDTQLNSVGNIVKTNNLLNFTGTNNYYMLYLNDFELITSTSNLPNAFAKILLSGQPGDVLYNTFINYPFEFDFPLSTLDELQIKIMFGDGTMPDFRNLDHSFILRITELTTSAYNTGINSKKTTFLSTMKEIAYDSSNNN
jgi:hypothetical protein